METSAVGVDEYVAIRSTSQLFNNRNISLVLDLIDQLIWAILQKHNVIIRK